MGSWSSTATEHPEKLTATETHAVLTKTVSCEREEGSALYYMLDVRTAEEYKSGHVPGSVNEPVTMDGGRTIVEGFCRRVQQRLQTWGKDAVVVVGCKSGRRSTRAIGLLRDDGIDVLLRTRELMGGFDAWVAAGDLPVATGDGSSSS